MQKAMIVAIRKAKALTVNSPYSLVEEITTVTLPKDGKYLEKGEDDNPLPYSDCLALSAGDQTENVIVRRGRENPLHKKWTIREYVATEDFDKEIDGQMITIKKDSHQVFAEPVF